MSDFLTDGAVATTVLFLQKIWRSATTYRLCDGHRFMTQHQLTITSPVPVTGSFKVRIIPDTLDAVLTESVDTGYTITMQNETSTMLLFSAVLRGIQLEQLVDFGNDKETLTIVLSSTRGQA